MAGVDNTFTKNSTTGIQNPFQQNACVQARKNDGARVALNVVHFV